MTQSVSDFDLDLDLGVLNQIRLGEGILTMEVRQRLVLVELGVM